MANLIFITRFFYRFFGRNMAVILTLTTLGVLFEGLGIAMFLPIIQGMDGSSGVSAWLLPSLEKIGLEYSLRNILMILSALFTVKAVVMMGQSVYITRLMTELAVDYRLNMLKGIFEMRYTHYLRESSGYFNNAMTTELQRAMFAFLSYCNMLTSVAFAFLHLLFPLCMNPELIFFLVIVGFPILIIMRKIHHKVRQISISISKSSADVQKSTIEVLHGYKYLKSTSMYTKVLTHILTKSRKLSGFQIHQKLYSSIPTHGFEPVAMMVLSCFIYYLLEIKGENLLTNGFILLLTLSSLRRFSGLQDYYNKLMGAYGSLLVLQEVEDKIGISTELKPLSAEDKIDFMQPIVFKHVGFEYIAGQAVLDDINITIEPCTTTAIVGPSGGGKTTFVNLLSRIIKPNEGTICLGRQPFENIHDSHFKSKLGYVTQENIIFKDTLWNNLTFWAPFSEELHQQVMQLIKELQLEDFFNQLPHGLETELSESGMDVSGGQRQRLFLVREILKKPSLLILDEATSALDSMTEEKINSYLKRIKGTMTIIIIAHRLSTVKHADIIHIFEEGKLRESGRFEELAENSALFAEMVAKQALSR